MRKQGFKCVTSVKLRSQLYRLLDCRAANAGRIAAEAVGRLAGVSEADSPERWPLWENENVRDLPGKAEALAALKALPVVPTPLRDPVEVFEADGHFWPCAGTTVLVARDTFELVRAADTYAGCDCYRPRGRMDEPFIPQSRRVCLVTADELRLIRLDGVSDPEIVFTYSPAATEDMTGLVVTRWPTPLRALCGEFPGLRVGVATLMVAGRRGMPFFLGLARGVGYEAGAENRVCGMGALNYTIQTNSSPPVAKFTVVLWEGGEDPAQLVRFGGLTIFTDRQGRRRKVQLRSLGLVQSAYVCGASVYDFEENFDTLHTWALTRVFPRKKTSQRERDRSRVRSCKALPESRRGKNIYNTSPHGIKVTLQAKRRAAFMLRQTAVSEVGGVTTVPLKNLMEGHAYCLNARFGIDKKTGEPERDQKRHKIRCPRWEPKDSEGMLAWLAAEPHVVMAGRETSGAVFAVVRVANGTEDQQQEAAARWAEAAGRRFPHATGCPSWHSRSIAVESETSVGALYHTNWRAEALETACYERYKTSGEYSKPLKIERRGTATASERARAYADKVEGLADEGRRNSMLSGAMLNIRDKFGTAALTTVVPSLLKRSTLGDREKAKIVKKVFGKTPTPKGEPSHG